MRNPTAREILRRGLGGMAGRVLGLMPAASVGALMAARMVMGTVANTLELPTDETDGLLQDATGAFYFLLGYSALDGGDILA